jgi:hypothetical protein
MNDQTSQRITFVMSESQATELKIMAILTKKTMSELIRLAIQDKIRNIKEKNKK